MAILPEQLRVAEQIVHVDFGDVARDVAMHLLSHGESTLKEISTAVAEAYERSLPASGCAALEPSQRNL
eukprot:4899566-Pleurochrysis_carterae.AAC.1